jgi:Ca2+-binding RTX toxin-like protein
MTRTLRVGLLGVVLALAIAPAAMASSVTVSNGSRLNVTSTGNERNQITVAFDDAAAVYTVTDATGINANGICTQADATTATCPGAGIGGITVSAGGGGDVVGLGPSDPASVEATLNGGSGDDTLIGGPADDALDGSSGRDGLNGQGGADELRGGSGTDTVTYADRVAGVAVSVGNGNDDDGNAEDQSGNDRDSVRSDIEIVAGGHGPDFVVGDGSSETLAGGDGDDVLIGQHGSDTLLGDAGSDFLLGGDGPDNLRGWIGADRIRGDNGNDLLAGGPDGDMLKGGFGHDRLRGKGGTDRLIARDGTRDLKISCGPGANRLERAKRDKRLDPRAKSC